MNRLRKGPVNGDAKTQISQALSRYAGIDQVTFVPYDLASLDRAIAAGRAIGEVAPESPARLALLPLAARLGRVSAGHGGRRRPGRFRARSLSG